MDKNEVKELISRRRRQILVHSFIYYRANSSVIDDHTYDLWSKELAELQKKYPEIARECNYAQDFEGFDGSSGFDLPLHLPEIVSKGMYLMRIAEKKRCGE